jgi:hypothetical protein
VPVFQAPPQSWHSRLRRAHENQTHKKSRQQAVGRGQSLNIGRLEPR